MKRFFLIALAAFLAWWGATSIEAEPKHAQGQATLPVGRAQAVDRKLAVIARSLRELDVAFCLGLPGVSMPNLKTNPAADERYFDSNPRSAEEIALLDAAVERAQASHHRAVELHKAGTGVDGRVSGTGVDLARARARLAWSKRQHDATIEHLNQAVEFAGQQVSAAKAVYQTGSIELEQVFEAENAKADAELTLLRIRAAFSAMGHEVKDEE